MVHESVQFEEANGGGCVLPKKVRFPSPCLLKYTGIEMDERLSTVATQYWAKRAWTRKWSHEQKRNVDKAHSRYSNVEQSEMARKSSDV